MNQEMNVYIVTMNATLSRRALMLFEQLMVQGAIIWLNGYETSTPNKELLSHFDNSKYKNVRVCYCNNDSKADLYNYWTSEWVRQCFSDESDPSMIYGPLKECDLCIMLTEKEIKGTSVNILGAAVTQYKKPVNVIHNGSTNNDDLDFCIIPDNFGYPLIANASTIEKHFWRYLDIRNTINDFPNIFQGRPRLCDFDGDAISLENLSI